MKTKKQTLKFLSLLTVIAVGTQLSGIKAARADDDLLRKLTESNKKIAEKQAQLTRAKDRLRNLERDRSTAGRVAKITGACTAGGVIAAIASGDIQGDRGETLFFAGANAVLLCGTGFYLSFFHGWAELHEQVRQLQQKIDEEETELKGEKAVNDTLIAAYKLKSAGSSPLAKANPKTPDQTAKAMSPTQIGTVAVSTSTSSAEALK